MRSTWTKMLAGAATLTLALSACASNGGTGTPSSSAPKASASASAGGPAGTAPASFNKQPYANLKDGGTLNLSITELTEQMNTFHGDGTLYTRYVWEWYNPQMITFSPEGDLLPNKAYIESIKETVKDNKTVVTYKLNNKAKFNDGTPIDVKAFENTWKTNNGTNKEFSPNATDGYSMIESVVAGVDNFEVVVTYQVVYPWYGMLFNTVLHPSINTPTLYNTAYVGTDTKAAHPELGAGPYKIESLSVTGATAVFVKNEKWWGDPGKLDKVVLTQREAQAALNAFKNGEADIIGASSKTNLDQIKTMTGIDIRRGGGTSSYLLTLNTKSPKLGDLKVREALMTGVNRTQIADVTFQGLDYTEKAPGSLALFPYQKGYQDNWAQVVPKFDATKAGQLLDEAGWKAGTEGLRVKDGVKLELNMPIFSDAALTKSRAQALQAQMKSIGVTLNVVQKTGQDFAKVMADRDFDFILSGFASSDPYGVAWFCQIYCSDSSLNKSASGTEALDAKIKAMEKLPTAEQQIAEANKIEVEAFKTFGLMPVYNGPVIYGAKQGLANMGAGVFAGDPYSAPREQIGWQK